MTIEEEIEQAFHEWWNATDDGGANISAYIMPLLNRVRAATNGCRVSPSVRSERPARGSSLLVTIATCRTTSVADTTRA